MRIVKITGGNPDGLPFTCPKVIGLKSLPKNPTPLDIVGTGYLMVEEPASLDPATENDVLEATVLADRVTYTYQKKTDPEKLQYAQHRKSTELLRSYYNEVEAGFVCSLGFLCRLGQDAENENVAILKGRERSPRSNHRYIDGNGVVQTITNAQFDTILDEIAAVELDLIDKHRSKLETVQKAATIAEVEAVTWND